MSCCSSSRTVSPVSRPPQKASGTPQANAATTQQQQQQQGAEEDQPRQEGPQSTNEFVVKGQKGSPHDMRQYEGKPCARRRGCSRPWWSRPWRRSSSASCRVGGPPGPRPLVVVDVPPLPRRLLFLTGPTLQSHMYECCHSKCSFAKNGYESATELFEKYKDRGFVVLAFPCNQFGSQEPDSDDEIKKFACKKYKAGFPIMSKCDVNGPKAEPLWEYMKNEKRGIFNSASIKWNFTSFLCDRNGKPIKRYSPGAKAVEIEEDLIPILEAGGSKEEDKTGGEAPVGMKSVENSTSDHSPA